MSIRGEKRKQLIEQWLRGEDNPEYEVRPTRREGRYIVTKRSQPAPDPSHGEPVKSGITFAERIEHAKTCITSTEQIESAGTDITCAERIKPTHSEHAKACITSAEQIEPAPELVDGKPTHGEHAKACITSAEQIESVDRDISLTILRELRMLGEDNRKRMERKEAKKEVKYQLAKQALSQPQLTLHPRSGLSRHRQTESEHEYEYEYEYEYEDEPVKPVKPIYVRRRLNLLSKYM